MKNLDPKYTKLRLYGRKSNDSQPEHFQKAVGSSLECGLIDAFELFIGHEGNYIVEIVALRQNIHQRVVPMIEEAFPGSFYTLESVCGFRVRS